MVLKILAGLPVVGCVVAIPFLVFGKSDSAEADRGKFHLSQQWKGCVNLLEEQNRQNRSNKKIYLCKLDSYSNKLEMIYYDSTNGSENEIVEKIQSIRQSAQGSYGHASKFILKLDKSGREESLDRPTTMLFDYTGGSSHDDQNLLFPDKECSISPTTSNNYTFSCENPSWKVVKPAFSLI